jgi:hypothetical protein
LSNYYFVAASLPMLRYDNPAGITRAYFLDLCKAHLSPVDFQLLAEAELFGFSARAPRSAIYKKYRDWETALRNELTILRAAGSGRRADPSLRPAEIFLSAKALAKRVFNEASPLRAEELIDEARWQQLEELELGHFFDLQRLLVYYLKLQLLGRRALFNPEEGKTIFTAIEQRVFEELKAGVKAYGE